MKKITFFLLSMFLFWQINAQSTIANWTFEDSTKRATVDASGNVSDYTPDEASGTIELVGGPTLYLSSGTYFATGSGGTGTYAVNSKDWDSGTGTKYWKVTVSTSYFTNITVSSKQRGSNTGPRDFKLQYSINNNDWFDVPVATITVAANFTTGVLTNVALAQECENQTNLYLRWIVTSDVSVNNSTVTNTDTNRIDDILIQGVLSFVNFYTVDFGVEGFNGDLKAFVNNVEIQSGNSFPQETNIVFKAIPVKGYKVDYWKYNILSENADVRVAFAEAVSPTLDRNVDTIDLLNLEDLDFTITWNDASRVDSVIANKGTEEEYILLQGVDYDVINDTLRLYVNNKSRSEFQIFDSVFVTVIFNIGYDQIIKFYLGSMAYNISYSVAQGEGTIEGYTFDQN